MTKTMRRWIVWLLIHLQVTHHPRVTALLACTLLPAIHSLLSGSLFSVLRSRPSSLRQIPHSAECVPLDSNAPNAACVVPTQIPHSAQSDRGSLPPYESGQSVCIRVLYNNAQIPHTAG